MLGRTKLTLRSQRCRSELSPGIRSHLSASTRTSSGSEQTIRMKVDSSGPADAAAPRPADPGSIMRAAPAPAAGGGYFSSRVSIMLAVITAAVIIPAKPATMPVPVPIPAPIPAPGAAPAPAAGAPMAAPRPPPIASPAAGSAIIPVPATPQTPARIP